MTFASNNLRTLPLNCNVSNTDKDSAHDPQEEIEEVMSERGTYFSLMLKKYNIAFEDDYDKNNPIYQILASTFKGSLYLLGYKEDVKLGLLKASFFDSNDSAEELDDSEPINLDDFLPKMSDRDEQGRRKIKTFDKSDVAQIYVDYEATRLCGKIPADRQLQLAKAAAVLFPEVGDSTAWYQKSVSLNGKSITSRGPAHVKMRNLAQKAVRLGVFPSSDVNIVDQDNSPTFEELKNDNVVDEILTNKYMSIRSELQEFYCSSELPEIFKTFKFLATAEGLNLLLSHFDISYPEQANKFSKKMHNQLILIYNYAKQCGNNNLKKYLQAFSDPDLTRDQQNSLSLQVLPLIMPPTKCRQLNVERAPSKKTKRSCKNKVVDVEEDEVHKEPRIWVAKPEEMLANFMHLVEIEGVNDMSRDEIIDAAKLKINEHRDALMEKYREHNLPLTAYIILLGNVKDIKKAHLYIGEQMFSFTGASCVVKAAEACYKLIKLCGKNFPKAASAVWEYLEWKVYDTPVIGMLQTTINFDRTLNTPLALRKNKAQTQARKRKA